ncbi:hypothetical protein CR513_55935, partial [Mucuna pruriens]
MREPLLLVPTNMSLNVAYSFVVSKPIGFTQLLEEFREVFLKDVPHGLPPLRGNQRDMKASGNPIAHF